VLLGGCRYWSGSGSQQVTPRKGGDKDWPALDPTAVSLQKLADHMAALTGPEMRGRDVLEDSRQVGDSSNRSVSFVLPPAVTYVADIFSSAKLFPPSVMCEKPPAALTNCVQQFDVTLRSLEQEARLVIAVSAEKESRKSELELGADFMPVQFTAGGTVSAPLFFAGYGVTALELYYDDYRGHDVRGKIVMVLEGLPGDSALPQGSAASSHEGASVWKNELHSSLLHKAANAKRHGAIGLLFVVRADGAERLRALGMWPSYLPARQERKMAPDEALRHNYTRASLALSLQAFAGRLSEEFEGNKPELFCQSAALQVEKDASSLLVFAVTQEAADKILSQAGSSVETAMGQIESSQKAASFELAGMSALVECEISARQWVGYNIIGVITPDARVKNPEWVVVGAHHDHLGINAGGGVFIGANDNASGVAVLLELARGFSHLSGKLRRGIVFCAFDAEERGLRGSQQFARNLPVPAGRIVAMLNLDMLGRKNPTPAQVTAGNTAQSTTGFQPAQKAEGQNADSAGIIWVIGALRNPELCEVMSRALAGEGFEVKSDIEFAFLRGGDHWPFHCAGVPALQLTTSRFPEMHTVEDTPDRISIQTVEKAARAVRSAVLELADRSGRFPAPKHTVVEYPK
jgi:hypothetical protein